MHRLESIQILRGVAAAQVLAFHAFLIVQNIASARGLPDAGTRFADGAVGVDLFFVISGFVMALSAARLHGRADVGRFLAQRIVRIAPLFYLLGAVAVAVAAARGAPFAWPSIATGLTILPVASEYHAAPLHQGWTLAFEFAFYAVVAGAVLAWPARRYAALLIALATLALLPSVVAVDHAAARFFANGIVLEFAFGVIVHLSWADSGAAGRRSAMRLAGVMGVGILLVQLIGGYQHGSLLHVVDGVTGLRRALDWGLPCALILAGAVTWRPGAGAGARLGKRLGEISYSLYLVHLLVLDAILPLLVGRVSAFGAVLLGFAASLAAGWAVYSAIERPLLRMMTTRLSAPKAVPAGG